MCNPQFTVVDDSRAKRNALLLTIAQAFYSSSTVILIATAGLVGAGLAPSRGWATLPVSAFVIGTMLTTFPASMLMRRVGRRPVFIAGALSGVASGLLGLYAIITASFPLFVLGAVLQGGFQATSQYFRFAAADDASPEFRPKAISWVLTGGVAAGLFGTLIVMKTSHLLDPYVFAGCYVASAALALAAACVLAFLNLPHRPEAVAGHARRLSEILAQPRLMAAILCGMMAYGMMNLVMTAAPLAMIGCGFVVSDSAWVIQWHVLAMFVPSFFTGSLVSRFGAERITALGMAMLAAAGGAALAGIHFENFALAMILLGLGWNFGFIGATTLISEGYAPSERAKVQGVNDFAIFTTVAAASLSSGKLLDAVGWQAVNYAVFPMAAFGLALVLWLGRREARAAV